MNDKEILKNAPKDGKATHFVFDSDINADSQSLYLKCSAAYDNLFHYKFSDGNWLKKESFNKLPRALADIQRIVDQEELLSVAGVRIVELEEEVKRLQPKTKCINCEEPEVSNNLCACCGWLQKEGKYEVKS